MKKCPAVLMIAGEWYQCDWIHLNEDGSHDGWLHTSGAAQAMWGVKSEDASD